MRKSLTWATTKRNIGMSIFEWVLCLDGMFVSSGMVVLALNAINALLGIETDMGGIFLLCYLTYALIWRSCGLTGKIKKITEGE